MSKAVSTLKLKFTHDELRALLRLLQGEEVSPGERMRVQKHIEGAVRIIDRLEKGL